MVERKRMVAEFSVINNFEDQKNLSEYIRIKSYDADLILMKLPKLIQGEEKIFINSTNNLFDQIGSSLFLEASNSFVGKLKSETNFKTISNPKNDINLEDFQGITIDTFDKKFNLNFAEWLNKFYKINQVFVKDLQTHLLSYQEYYINVFNNKNLVN